MKTTAAQLEIMLFVTCAKCWRQQQSDGSLQWAAQAIVHPFLQTEPHFGKTVGDALLHAYSSWKQHNP